VTREEARLLEEIRACWRVHGTGYHDSKIPPFLRAAVEMLEAKGLIFSVPDTLGTGRAWVCQRKGIALDYTAADVARRKDL
jgi:hypothetical protein